MKMTTSLVPMLVMVMLVVVVMNHAKFGKANASSPPEIKEPKARMELFKESNEKVTVLCHAEGNPKPKYRWYRAKKGDTDFGQEVEPDNENAEVRYSSSEGTLFIDNLTKEVAGIYTCWATNVISNQKVTAISPKVAIGVASMDSWDKVDVLPVSATEYSSAVLNCPKAPVFSGPATHSWWYTFQDSGRLDMIPQNERIFIDAEGDLHFAYVTSELDVVKDRQYACGLSSGLTRRVLLGTSIELNIMPLPTEIVHPIGPMLVYPAVNTMTEVTSEIEKQAALSCFYSGYDPTAVMDEDKVPKNIWIVNDKVIQTGGRYTLIDNGHTLLVDHVTLHDENDIYKCIGTLGGKTSDPALIKINAISAPIFVKKLNMQTVIQGQDATFHCDANSLRNENAPDMPVWFGNGKRLTEGTDKFVFSENRKTLMVTSVEKAQDFTCFMCLVSNSVGESSSAGCLSIILPINVTTKPPPEQKVWIGDIVDLTVVAETDPDYPVTYRWTFRGKALPQGEDPRFVTHLMRTHQTVINTAKFPDKKMEQISGVYRLEIYHEFQSVVVEVTVELDPPEQSSMSAVNFWIIGLILALLIIIIIIIICCCVICRRKMQEGDYPVDRKETAAGMDPEKEMKESAFPALSRASLIPRDDPYRSDKKPSNLDIDDIDFIQDDDSFGSADYDGEGPSAFNEDGSFIGVYKIKPKNAMDNPGFSRDNRGYRRGSESNV